MSLKKSYFEPRYVLVVPQSSQVECLKWMDRIFVLHYVVWSARCMKSVCVGVGIILRLKLQKH